MRGECEETGEWLAMSRNMSGTGALLATAVRLEVGQPVTVAFQVRRPLGQRTITPFPWKTDSPAGFSITRFLPIFIPGIPKSIKGAV